MIRSGSAIVAPSLRRVLDLLRQRLARRLVVVAVRLRVRQLLGQFLECPRRSLALADGVAEFGREQLVLREVVEIVAIFEERGQYLRERAVGLGAAPLEGRVRE